MTVHNITIYIVFFIFISDKTVDRAGNIEERVEKETQVRSKLRLAALRAKVSELCPIFVEFKTEQTDLPQFFVLIHIP